jgi:hypothetical protein
MATTLKKVIQSAPKMRGSLPIKAQTGVKATKDSTAYFKRASDSFMTIANDENKKGNEGAANKLVKLAKSSFESQKRQSKKGKPGYDANGFPKKKNGGTVAKDGKWMQKAAASIKKRGTAGKCTPITKPGCTGKAKALAKTFKKIAKSNKKK